MTHSTAHALRQSFRRNRTQSTLVSHSRPSFPLQLRPSRFPRGQRVCPSSLLFPLRPCTTSTLPPTSRTYATKTTTATTPDTCCASMTGKMTEDMKRNIATIFENNKKWVSAKKEGDGAFFDKLAAGQTPDYLYIGCSDSRVPANEIMGLEAGEVFVHRNIANLVPNIDLNVMSVVNYAVRHLGVKHIIVCGHYNCGGVKAALTPTDLGLLNPWLRNIRDVYRLHEKELDAIQDETKRYNRLVELNVVESCRNVIKTAAVQQSYRQKQYPIVHGWVFDLQDGLLRDLHIDFEEMLKDVMKIYHLSDNEMHSETSGGA